MPLKIFNPYTQNNYWYFKKPSKKELEIFKSKIFGCEKIAKEILVDKNYKDFHKFLKKYGLYKVKWNIHGIIDDYKGYAYMGQRHGKGKTIYGNGDVEEGNYKNNDLHGFGKEINKDGTKAIGKWKNGTFVKGLSYELDGDISEGSYKNRMLFKGTVKMKDGTIFKGIWKGFNVTGIRINRNGTKEKGKFNISLERRGIC